MALEFDEEKHLYTLNGVELPSVTEICRFLNYDTAVNAKPWLRDAAADVPRGTPPPMRGMPRSPSKETKTALPQHAVARCKGENL